MTNLKSWTGRCSDNILIPYHPYFSFLIPPVPYYPYFHFLFILIPYSTQLFIYNLPVPYHPYFSFLVPLVLLFIPTFKCSFHPSHIIPSFNSHPPSSVSSLLFILIPPVPYSSLFLYHPSRHLFIPTFYFSSLPFLVHPYFSFLIPPLVHPYFSFLIPPVPYLSLYLFLLRRKILSNPPQFSSFLFISHPFKYNKNPIFFLIHSLFTSSCSFVIHN